MLVGRSRLMLFEADGPTRAVPGDQFREVIEDGLDLLVVYR
jgi:hypothetical protein